jgi:DNA ligase (NAD+)
MGAKSAQNVLDNIEASKQRPLINVLYALGVRYVGYQTAEILARAFGSMDRLRQASLDAIVAVEGIGPKIAESVHDYFHDPDNLRVVDKLAAAGVNMHADTGASDGALAGLNFVVTGRLESYTRTQIEQRIKDLGGVVGDSVSKKTDYLVAGEDAGSKLAKAQKLGTVIVDEAGLEQLIQDRAASR